VSGRVVRQAEASSQIPMKEEGDERGRRWSPRIMILRRGGQKFDLYLQRVAGVAVDANSEAHSDWPILAVAVWLCAGALTWSSPPTSVPRPDRVDLPYRIPSPARA
jgi:hypothetical protein